MVTALFYVSRSTLHIPQESGRVQDIVAEARSRNAKLDVTGALMFTETHFAQFLEGPRDALDELMSSILADPRHCEVEVILNRPAKTRRFNGWSMAYTGPSTFVKRRIGPLVEQATGTSAAGRQQEASNIIRLMSAFVGDAEAAAGDGQPR